MPDSRPLTAADAPRLHDSEEERRYADREQGDARVVQPMWAALPLRQRPVQEQHCDGAERQVHVEHPSPRDVVGEEPAQQGPEQRGHAPHAGHVALFSSALLEAEQLADDRHPERHERARAEPLQHAEGDQLLHGLRGAGERGAGQKDRQAGEVDRTPAEEIGEPAPQGHGHRGAEQESGEDPRIDVDAAEALHDGRHGGRHHRRFHRGQEDREHHAVERAALAAIVH
jgi:hypothetical protein